MLIPCLGSYTAAHPLFTLFILMQNPQEGYGGASCSATNESVPGFHSARALTPHGCLTVKPPHL